MSARYDLFTSATSPHDLRVVAFTCEERLCAPFRLEILAQAPLDSAEDVARRLLGQPATFVMRSALGGDQTRRGIVVQALVGGGLDSGQAEIRIVVAPRLALMGERVHSRIFQGLSIEEILKKVLAPWQLEVDFQLGQKHPKRPYCTQYRETDLAFLDRLCAREGLSYFFAHEPLGDDEAEHPAAETLVFVDLPSFYPPLPSGNGTSEGNTLVHTTERFHDEEHQVSGFAFGRAVRPELVRLGDFDFRRPGLQLSAIAGLPRAERTPIGDALGGELIAHYLHHDRGELEGDGNAPEIDDAVAQVRLGQLRREAELGSGKSRCPRLRPGAVFALDHHPMGGLNQSYLVTRVLHRGRIAEEGEESTAPYDNDFDCVPSGTLFSPIAGPAPVQQAMETATVVGPKSEEIHVDEHGRVKVQFHWDLEGDRDDKSSCWLRVTQPWAGANWGAQFLPRIGTEVLVGFIGGDVDRPVVTGSLYNGARPSPYRLPSEVGKSGFRSQSTPGGEGFSELTFDDTKGRESMMLRAQRDFQHFVENDYQLSVKKEVVQVSGESERTVLGDSRTSIQGEGEASYAKSFQMTVKGHHALSIEGDTEASIAGNRVTRIEGKEQLELADFQATYRDSQIQRVLGHLVMVIGQEDAQKSLTTHVEGSASQFTTGTTEISSDKDIVLRVGDSALRITPDGIDIIAKKVRLHGEDVQAEVKDKLLVFADEQIAFKTKRATILADEKVVLKGKEGQLQLDENARLDGTQVKLNCQPDPVDEEAPPEYEPPKKTTLSLSDEDGKPLSGRRFLVRLADGSELAGVLDDEGKAELYIDEDAKVIFPDADNPRKA
ncbi:MAG: type VI secretion system tip protein TssI/VgrG [Polyangiaceae bacterium]